MALSSAGIAPEHRGSAPVPEALAARRWETFDLLRACAASLVFVFHYCVFAAPLTAGIGWLDSAEHLVEWSGSIGTNLLLLISGFFVAKSVGRAGYRYSNYLWKRVGRIYPPYVMVVAVEVLFLVLFPTFQREELHLSNVQELAKNLLLWPGLFPGRPALTVAWTLSWIMAGYVLLPAPLSWLRRHVASGTQRFSILIVVLLAYVGWAAATHIMAPRLGYILCGCAVYELIAHEAADLSAKVRSRWLVLVALGCISARLTIDALRPWKVGENVTTFCYVLFGLTAVSLLAIAAILAQARHPERWSTFPLRSVQRFGRTGYSFYLLHGAVVKVFAAAIFPRMAADGAAKWSYWLVMPACFALSAAASTVMYRGVEAPLQRWLNSAGRTEGSAMGLDVAQRA